LLFALRCQQRQSNMSKAKYVKRTQIFFLLQFM
jgi:hypothetical protein